jgi:ubiquinone/menaquinone biosynthesis C-methylase UbiE
MESNTENLEIEMIDRFVDLQEKKVLEIGCGEGRMSKLLAQKSGRFIGIDPDEKSIEKAKSEIPNIDFRVGNGEALEFEDASFPVIFFTLSLHHHENSHLALKEAQRVLSKEGRLIILEPVADCELTQFYSLFDNETERLLDTLHVIETSDFEIDQRETVKGTMTFENTDELGNYDFDQNEIQPGDRDRIIQLLQKLRGAVIDEQPIHLEDHTHIFSIRKKR